MDWYSKEGIVIVSAFIAITVFVTLFVQNSINRAIERRAMSLASGDDGPSSMISALGNMVSGKAKAHSQTVSTSKTSKTSKTPPEGSGKRYTPL